MFPYALPDAWAWTTHLLALGALAEAARRARWTADWPEHLIWALATAWALLGQAMGFALSSGLSLHYLGSAFLALLVGYPRALLSMALVLFLAPWLPGSQAIVTAGPGTWGLRVLVEGLLPIWTMWSVVQFTRRHLVHNLFVFLLGCGLFGLLLSYLTQLLAAALCLQAFAPPTPSDFPGEFLPYAFLLASGEAWLEGMLITVLAVYLPRAVALYDEALYLRRR